MGVSRRDRIVQSPTVAERSGAITRRAGPKAIADFGFADCPPLDLILFGESSLARKFQPPCFDRG